MVKAWANDSPRHSVVDACRERWKGQTNSTGRWRLAGAHVPQQPSQPVHLNESLDFGHALQGAMDPRSLTAGNSGVMTLLDDRAK